MNPLHKTVEMYARLTTEGQALKKGIHKVGLTPPHTAPKVETDLGLYFTPAKFVHPDFQITTIPMMSCHQTLV